MTIKSIAMIHIFNNQSKISIFFTCTVLIFSLYSCNEKRKSEIIDNYSEIVIDNSNIPDTLDISNLIDYIKILKLTDPSDKPISRIDQLYASDNTYIAIDAINTKRVNSYSADGSYLKTLMEVGSDKKQSLNVTDCYQNEKNEVIIYDYAQMMLTVFNPDLSVKKVIQGKNLFHYNHIASIPGTEEYVGYASYNLDNAYLQGDEKNPSNLDVLNSKLDLTKKILTYPSKFEGVTLITASKSFFPYKDSLRFFRTYDPYIYNISKNQIERRFKVLYSKGNFPSDFLESIVANHLKEFKETGSRSYPLQVIYQYCSGYTCPENWLESDSVICLSSINFLDRSTSITNTVVLNQAKKRTVLNAGTFVAKNDFKLSFPQFKAYDKYNNEFLASCTGNQLKKRLYKGSSLINLQDIVDDSFYLIKVKFKPKQ